MLATVRRGLFARSTQEERIEFLDARAEIRLQRRFRGPRSRAHAEFPTARPVNQAGVLEARRKHAAGNPAGLLGSN